MAQKQVVAVSAIEITKKAGTARTKDSEGVAPVTETRAPGTVFLMDEGDELDALIAEGHVRYRQREDRTSGNQVVNQEFAGEAEIETFSENDVDVNDDGEPKGAIKSSAKASRNKPAKPASEDDSNI